MEECKKLFQSEGQEVKTNMIGLFWFINYMQVDIESRGFY